MKDDARELLQKAAPALRDIGAVLEKHGSGESTGLVLALALHLESMCRVCDVFAEDFVQAAQTMIDSGVVTVPTPQNRMLGRGRG